MFISTFRYKPEYVACPLCTEYRKTRAVRSLLAHGWLNGSRPEWWGIRRR